MKPLRITFVTPPASLTGGIRVLAIYAAMLQGFGHAVTVVSEAQHTVPLSRALRDFVRGRGWPKKPYRAPMSHLDNTPATHRVLRHSGSVTARDVPDADVVIATWWETAEWVARLPESKGRKVYFIQHHEVVFGDFMPRDRIAATYREPMHKIVIAKWLADAMAEEHGDPTADIVPNAVDHTQFHAPPRSRQSVPTVGLLYSNSHFKDIPVALDAVRHASRLVDGLAVRAFAAAPPKTVAEDINLVSLEISPTQERIREIYASCDVWLTASRSEGFNLPAMEAMACRTPVVSTRTGWPAEAIRDGVNGQLCEVGDVAGLGEALAKVLTAAPETWEAMSEAAFDTVRDASWERSARQFEAVLLRVAERRVPG